jgi:uncharacterized sodium:solute symporter family permease YidK
MNHAPLHNIFAQLVTLVILGGFKQQAPSLNAEVLLALHVSVLH